MKFLTEAEKNFYLENGFVHLRNVFDEPEVEEISAEYDDVFRVKKKLLAVGFVGARVKATLNLGPNDLCVCGRGRALLGSLIGDTGSLY